MAAIPVLVLNDFEYCFVHGLNERTPAFGVLDLPVHLTGKVHDHIATLAQNKFRLASQCIRQIGSMHLMVASKKAHRGIKPFRTNFTKFG